MKHNTFKTIVTLLAFIYAPMASAQLMTVNDQKTKFEGGVQYRTGDAIATNGEGNLYTNAGFWHNFIFSPLQKVGIELHHQYNDGHNHYLRVGANGMKVFMLPGYKQAVAVTANLYGEGSQKGLKHFDGVVSTLLLIKMQQKDTRGVGFIFLVNNPMKMFALPIFTWKKTINDHLGFDWMTYLGTFDYHINKSLKLTAAYSLGFERYWVQDEGETRMANEIPFTPSLSLHYDITKKFTVAAIGGAQIPIMGSLYSSNGGELIRKLQTHRSTFIQGQIYLKF